jgi:hypothetical protein
MHRNERGQTRSIDLAARRRAAVAAFQRGRGVSSVALTISHDMPATHGTHVDFIAPWARALDIRSRWPPMASTRRRSIAPQRYLARGA